MSSLNFLWSSTDSSSMTFDLFPVLFLLCSQTDDDDVKVELKADELFDGIILIISKPSMMWMNKKEYKKEGM